MLGLLLLIERGGAGALDPYLLGTLAAATIAVFAAFLAVELRTPEPVVELRLFARRGFSAGLAASFLNFVAMAAFTPTTPLAWIITVLAGYGLGAALFQSPNLVGLLAAAPPQHAGVANGTLATVGRLGQIAGITIAGVAWQAGLDRHGPTALGPAFRDAFLTLAAFGVIAALASSLRGPATPASSRPDLPTDPAH